MTYTARLIRTALTCGASAAIAYLVTVSQTTQILDLKRLGLHFLLGFLAGFGIKGESLSIERSRSTSNNSTRPGE